MNGAVRGGSKGCPRFKTNTFKLGCLVAYSQEQDLLYEIKINVGNRIYIEEEALYKVPVDKLSPRSDKIFKTKPSKTEGADIKVEYKNGKRGTNPDVLCIRTAAILPQILTRMPHDTEEERQTLFCIQTVRDSLKNILVLNSIPQNMRGYARISDCELRVDCENISSVMREMCRERDKKQELLDIIGELPENEVLDIEFIETQVDDVIFALKEKYINSTEVVDARKLSDGTLRCMAVIVAALVSVPGSMLIMEEVDNGIHPTRVEKLMDSLLKIGKKRGIDIIVTTHNLC